MALFVADGLRRATLPRKSTDGRDRLFHRRWPGVTSQPCRPETAGHSVGASGLLLEPQPGGMHVLGPAGVEADPISRSGVRATTTVEGGTGHPYCVRRRPATGRI